ncbi:hypothetical protein C8F04DRAFT_1043596 [Mycena alexandri]|uniref:Cyclin N-terminal domain-containing protein n=1 Tax=Mycena alexandri TaxID=1745969 RepID=A0AAD6SMS4_9AGAR|nr:hypothetical protein C8F04DRAFT_1043596 [Mycena alexandri]
MSTPAHDSAKTALFASVRPSSLLMQLLHLPIDRPVIDYIVHCVSGTVTHALGRSEVPSSYNAPFTSFVSTVLARCAGTIATVLTSLSYISRARPNIYIPSIEWAIERVFLGALIVASKYTGDSTMRNVHWAACTGIFSTRDICRIESEFLEVLDRELGVSEADLLAQHAGLTAPQPKPPQIVRPAITHSQHASPVISGSVFVFMPELDPSGVHSPSSEISLPPRTPRSISPSRSRSRTSICAPRPRHPSFSPESPYPRRVHTEHHGGRDTDVDLDMDINSPPCPPPPRGRPRHRAFGFAS